jgi:hypothetical protein
VIRHGNIWWISVETGTKNAWGDGDRDWNDNLGEVGRESTEKSLEDQGSNYAGSRFRRRPGTDVDVRRRLERLH